MMDKNDLTRAYEEYASCYRQQEGTKMLSFEQWIVTPIFCFKFEGALPFTIDNTAFINTVYRTSSVRNVYMFACAYYNDNLHLKFDKDDQFVILIDINEYSV